MARRSNTLSNPAQISSNKESLVHSQTKWKSGSREKGACRVFLSCENQIFLKLLRRRWLAEKAATAMTGQGQVCTHNLIHHRAPDTISINLSSTCTPSPQKNNNNKNNQEKKQYFYSITSDWNGPSARWPLRTTVEGTFGELGPSLSHRQQYNTKTNRSTNA